MGLQEFEVGVAYVGPGIVSDASGSALDVVHQAVKIIARIGDAHYSDCGALPQVAVLEFGDRHVELPAQPVLQAADHLAFVLERVRTFYAQFEDKKGDQSSGRRSP